MSGNSYPRAGRSAGDVSQTVFRAVPNPTYTDSRAPVQPYAPPDHRRRVPPPPAPLSHLELGPLEGAVPSARKHARVIMRDWDFDDEFIGIVELLVSELATNALYASRALKQLLPSPIHLWLQRGLHRITITVWDGNPQPPVLRECVPADAENGRGLFLVDYFSERWGWFEPAEIGGKCVRCEVTRESAARTAP